MVTEALWDTGKWDDSLWDNGASWNGINQILCIYAGDADGN